MSIIPEKWHPSWNAFMTEEKITMLQNIEKQISNYTPEAKNVLRFLSRDLNEIKCIWVGQDPYYTMYDENKYVANGAAFWPNDLLSWHQPFSQRSLQNIIRGIYASINNIEEYKDIPKYNQIKAEMTAGTFNILPPQEWFSSIEKQGVLLLNTYFTTEIGKSNAHRKIWEPFSEELIKFIAQNNKHAIWFLWGSEAQSKKTLIGEAKTYESNHPTFCSEKYTTDFLRNRCFKETKQHINWLGEK